MEELQEDDNKEKRNNPFLAALLTIFLPGAGHVYNGEYVKGLIINLILFLSGLFYTLNLFYDFISFRLLFPISISLFVPVYLYLIISSFLKARKVLRFSLSWDKKFVLSILGFVFIFIAGITSDNIYKTRFIDIENHSMFPTLCKGEAVYALRVKGYEYLNEAEILAFKRRMSDKNIITCRIIAKSGSKIKLIKNRIYIDGKPVKKSKLIPKNEAEKNLISVMNEDDATVYKEINEKKE